MLRKIIAVLISLLGPKALAAHPLTTDDVGTQGHGRMEAELSALAVRGTQGSMELGVGVAIHAGLGERVDLGAGIGITNAIGDPMLDLKWRLIDADTLPGLALRIDYVAPVTGASTAGAVLITSWHRDAWEWHFNVGTRASAIGSRTWSLAGTADLGASWAVSDRLRVLGEMVLDVDVIGRAVAVSPLAALQWQASSATILSLGVGPGPLPTLRPGWLLALGLTVTGG